MDTSTKLTPTSKFNLCPICQGSDGDCRTAGDLVLCHSNIDSDPKVSGYRFKGANKTGVWGVFAPFKGFETTYFTRTLSAQKPPQEKENTDALPVVDRDKWIRKISREVGLTTRHRQSLRDRGLTDSQIDTGYFFSIHPDQELPAGAPSNLPGVSNGRFAVAGAGIACPSFDVSGRITGWQIRLDDSSKGGKYRWAINGKLSNNEMPLTVCQPEKLEKANSVGIAEGLLKPCIAAQKLGQIVIGASGGHHTGSQKQMEEALEALKPKVVTLYPDAGMTTNRQMMQQYQKTLTLLKGWGYQVNVAWWGQTEKSGPDIDELSDFANIKYITPDEFYEISRQEIYRKKVRDTQKKLSSLNYPALEVNQRYLDIKLSSEPGIYFIKSQMGTGKTETIKKITESNQASNKRTLLFGSRNGLLTQTGSRTGIPHFWSLKVKGNTSITNTLLRNSSLAMCVDSLWQLKPEDCKDVDLIIDEGESVVDHLLSGNTCSKRRAELCTKLEQIIESVITGGGRVILMDAHLSNTSVDYFKDLTPEGTQIFGTINNWKPDQGWQVSFYNGSTDGVSAFVDDKSPLLQNIISCLKKGGIPAIATDSQKDAESLERELTGLGFIGGLRVDSETSENNSDVKKFLENPNKFISENRPSYLIYTPTMESGVSIDVAYFTDVFAFFIGVLTTQTQMQMLGRIRAPIPRHVFSKVRGIPDEDGTHQLPEEVEARFRQYHDSNNLLIQLIRPSIGEDPTDAQISDAIAKSWNSPHLKTWAKIKARENYQKAHLRDELKAALVEAGHTIRDVTGCRDSGLNQEIKAHKDDIEQEWAEEISSAEDIPISQARLIQESDTSTKKDRAKAQKAVLTESLPGVNLTPEFVLKAHVKNRGDWLKRAYTDWMLRHPEVQKERDRQNWKHHLNQPFVALQDIKAYALKLKALKDLGVLEILDPNREFSAESEQDRINSIGRRKARQAAQILNIKLKTKPIIFLRSLLDKVGAKLERVRQDKATGIRYYRISRDYWDDPDLIAVRKAFDTRFLVPSEQMTKTVSKMPETFTTEHLQRKHSSCNSIYNNTAQVLPDFKSESAALSNTTEVIQTGDRVIDLTTNRKGIISHDYGAGSYCVEYSPTSCSMRRASELRLLAA